MNISTLKSPYRRIHRRRSCVKILSLLRLHFKMLGVIRNFLRCMQGMKSFQKKSKFNCKNRGKSNNFSYYIERESMFYKVAIEDCLEYIKQSVGENYSSHGSNQKSWWIWFGTLNCLTTITFLLLLLLFEKPDSVY